jgi:hypothetical protein
MYGTRVRVSHNNRAELVSRQWGTIGSVLDRTVSRLATGVTQSPRLTPLELVRI